MNISLQQDGFTVRSRHLGFNQDRRRSYYAFEVWDQGNCIAAGDDYSPPDKAIKHSHSAPSPLPPAVIHDLFEQLLEGELSVALPDEWVNSCRIDAFKAVLDGLHTTAR